ncbi:MAG: GHMP family kinase ATP-binding protein [Candidatus Thorarchaeota archaeon]
MASSRPFRVRAPGRVCLFGEHSDYLGLDVIPAAIDLYIEITAHPRDDDLIHVDYLDTGVEDEFPIDTLLAHRNERDYLRSAFNVVLELKKPPKNGWDVRVSGNIPLAGGLSSSSALAVASILAAGHMGGLTFSPSDLSRYAYEAEVERFGESGGMMDHVASAFGGITHVSMTSDQKVTHLPADLQGFVIGDSRKKKKDTVGDLREIRKTVEAGYKEMARKHLGFDRRITPLNEVLSRSRSNESVLMAEGTLKNRDLTAIAFELLQQKKPDDYYLGELLNQHHVILRDYLHRSTPKIEKMIVAARGAGALGCKINGSGGGGTMLAYASGWEKEVASAIVKAGGEAHIVGIGQRATLTILKE